MSDLKKEVEEFHASRPGLFSYLILGGLALLFLVIVFRTSIEKLLGLQS